MARILTITIADDLEPQYEASETILFALDGVEYEIALSSVNANRLRKSFAPYIEAARRVGGRIKRSHHPSLHTANDLEQSKAIRAWASSNGFRVGERGRLPQHIIDAYVKSKHSRKDYGTHLEEPLQ